MFELFTSRSAAVNSAKVWLDKIRLDDAESFFRAAWPKGAV